MPKMYARGILFGKMVLELGDMCYAKNEKTGMSCDIDFKTKVCCPFFSQISMQGIYLVFVARDSFLGHTTPYAGEYAKTVQTLVR